MNRFNNLRAHMRSPTKPTLQPHRRSSSTAFSSKSEFHRHNLTTITQHVPRSRQRRHSTHILVDITTALQQRRHLPSILSHTNIHLKFAATTHTSHCTHTATESLTNRRHNRHTNTRTQHQTLRCHSANHKLCSSKPIHAAGSIPPFNKTTNTTIDP